MADFVDDEAEESSEEEREVAKHNGKKRKKQAMAIDDSDEDDEVFDEERLREELKDLINDDSIDESEEDESNDAGNSKKKRRKRSQSADFDDRLEDDDYDLLEENLGVAVQRKKQFKRLKRMENQDSDEEKEPADERDAIANELFNGSGDEAERESVVSQRREPDAFTEVGSEADVSDADDFIVDEDGKPVSDKRRKTRTTLGDAALQEAQEIFGIDFDYKEFEKEDGEEDEDEDEEEDEECIDDDVNGEVQQEKTRKTKASKRKKRRTIFDLYEPSELKRGHFTDLDNEIRNTDVPERMQMRSIPVTPVPEGSDELNQEAKWIYKYAFCRPTISIQDAHLNEGAKERARKGPQAIGKIRKALDFMRNQNFEVPFISFYRKEYVSPELNINDLWKVYKYDAKWCELRRRKESLELLFEKMRGYQLDEIMKNPDAPLPEGIRVIKEEDIDRLKSVETIEELNDVRHHFMLYYSHEIPNMQAEVRLKEKEARLAARLEKRREREKAKANNEDEEIPYHYGMDLVSDEDDGDYRGINGEEGDMVLKQAASTGPYALCRKAGLEGFAKKFGLTPEQYAENLRDNYQRNEIDQEPTEPLTVAISYIGRNLKTIEETVQAAQLMVAIQLAREPLVRKCIREMYMERAKISVRPTKQGIKEIDENHPIYAIKYLKDKPVRELVGDEYMKLFIAEKDKLVTLKFSEVVEGTTTDNYLNEMTQLYHRDEFSKNVQDWNALRAESVKMAFEKMLIPDMQKELRTSLMAECKEFVLRSCCRKMYNWIKVAPYVPRFNELGASAGENAQEEETWDDDDGRPKEPVTKKRYDEDDEDWNYDKGIRVMGLAYVPDYSQAAFACIIAPDGDCTDYLRLPNFLRRKKSPREEDRTAKEADLLALRNFIATKKPHVVVIGGESREAKTLADEIRECITILVNDEKFPPIEVEICENELAKIYSNSNRGKEEFREYPIILRQAISIARRLQDPLVEFSQLCGPDDEILCINYHYYQDQVPKDELLENLTLEFVNRVNEVGVDLNRALQHENSANLVQFVCGFGSRKAQALIKLLKQTNKRIENRTQLVTICHMGPKVFINCAGFIKVDTASLGDSTEAYVEVLDGTRVHPETYEWARKMAVDALERDDLDEDDENANPAGAVEEILETPERLKELDLDAFADELERQGFGNKGVTLYDIRAELNCRYKDLRLPYESPSPEKLFDILTKETPETFYIGKLILATVGSMNRRKPEGEQLDQANPVRNEDTSFWECPFCRKNDFPELSEVWSHFDAGDCPGKTIGVILRLDNGISGYIHVRNLSDKHVANPEDRVRVGQVIHCRITKIELDRFSVECTSKGSDLADKNNEWRPPRDTYYDVEAEEKDLQVEEEAKKTKQRQAYVKRVIVHSSFHNINYAEAAKLLEPMKQGEAIIRPSSKGNDHLTVTWKVTDDVLHHIDVREDGKKFAFSLGKKLFIGDEEFEDLDEIIARYVNPMAAYASELLDCHYYKQNIDGLEEKANEIMKEQKKENPNRIPCILSASKKYPAKFLLSYMPREKCVHEYISVSSNGVRFRGRTFAQVGELFIWFRKHFRDPRPVVAPKTPFSTPFNLPDTGQDQDDDFNHHTLSMSASDTPFSYVPPRTPGSQYGSSYPDTPYTPSAKTPFMTPCNNGSTPYNRTPNYGQSTFAGNKNEFPRGRGNQSGFNQRSNTARGSMHSYGSGSTEYDNSGGNQRGRGARGRGARGRGRGRGGGFNASSGSRMGDNTPLWDEQNTSTGAGRWQQRYNSNRSNSASMGNNTPLRDESENCSTGDNRAPLWNESESWDEPETSVSSNRPQLAKSAFPPSSHKPSTTNYGESSNASTGNRAPLYDPSESWDDDPEPAALQNRSLPPIDSNVSQRMNNGGASSTLGSTGGRTPLYAPNESWDDEPEPAALQNRSLPPLNSSYNMPPPMKTNVPSSGRSKGGRTPLYAPSESWDDDPVPAALQNRSLPPTNSSYNRPPPNRTNVPSSGGSKGGRTPLYAPSESWDDDPVPAALQNRSLPPPISSYNMPPSMKTNVPSSGGSKGGRTPLYAPSESWDDDPVPAALQNRSLPPPISSYNMPPSMKTNVPSSGGSKGGRTPLYAPSESWDDDPVPAALQNRSLPPSISSYNMPPPMKTNVPSSGGSKGGRTPLYAPSESWDDDPVPAALQNRSLPPPNSSYNMPPPMKTNVPSSGGSKGGRTPLYAPSESWDDEPTPAALQNRSLPPPNSSYNMPPPMKSNVPSSYRSKGSRTPLYAPSESWDDEPAPAALQNRSLPPTNSSYNRPPPNRTNVPSSVGPKGSRTPLYAPSESWDDDAESIVPNNTATTSSKTGGFSASRPIGSRTPLYAPSESWDDDPAPAALQKPSLPARNSFDNVPRSNKTNVPSGVGSVGSRTPLYAPSESWDDDGESIVPKSTAPKSLESRDSRSQTVSSRPPPPTGSRTPLYAPSESWDDEPEPAALQNRSLSSANSSCIKTNAPSSVGSIGGRTPLYAPSESWDDEAESIPPKSTPSKSLESSRGNQPTKSAALSGSRPIGGRTPLYAPNESWDDEAESVVPNNTASTSLQSSRDNPQSKPNYSSSSRPISSRTPLYAPTESWDDDPEPARTQNRTITPRNSSLDKPQRGRSTFSSGFKRKGARTPLYAPTESWNDDLEPAKNSASSKDPPMGKRSHVYAPCNNWYKPETSKKQPFQMKKSSYVIPRYNTGRMNIPPAGSRTPLYKPNESWDKPESTVPKNRSSIHDKKSSYNDSRTNNAEKSSTKPAGGRTPLYDPSESWD